MNLATEKEKTIQSIYELRVEYPNKLRDWGRNDADEWFSTQLGFIFDHIASVAKQEGRQEMGDDIRKWADEDTAKNGLYNEETGGVFTPQYPVVFKNDLLALLAELTGKEETK